MSELISLEELEADAVRAADKGLDPKLAMKAWPEHTHDQWLIRYYQRAEMNSQKRAA